jgi:hypothetical protein
MNIMIVPLKANAIENLFLNITVEPKRTKKMKILILLAGLCIACLTSFAQDLPSNEEEYLAEYQKRIEKEVLYGVYIPIDLSDSFRELDRLSAPDDIEKFKIAPEELVRTKLHFGLGKWISHNWGFYGGSRLSHYLKTLGLSFPDDMSRFVIVSWHRHLNDIDLDIENHVEYYRQQRLDEHKAREKEKEIIHLEKRRKKQ